MDFKLAVEEPIPVIRRMDRTQACRITYKGIYRELGVPNVRHRRFADPAAYLRRLLSLDYVIEHPELEWLPTEEEKVLGLEFVGKTVHQEVKASLASSAAAPALTLGCAPRCRLVWAMGNGASGGGSGHRV